MNNHHSDRLQQIETTCASLLKDLQSIWDEVGEPNIERDEMLLELEQECLEAYKRKVSHAKKSRAQLRQAIADSEAELADICSAMGEGPVNVRQFDQNAGGGLKEELKTIVSTLEAMRKLKCERKKQFVEVLDQLLNISKELCKPREDNLCKIFMDETDLSLKRLHELHRLLLELQDEKSNRVKQVLAHLKTLDSLCKVLGLDFKHTVAEIHPSMDDSIGLKNLSSNTIDKLAATILSLREVKTERMHKLRDLAASMLELWSLMDTPIKEQQMFQNVTSNIAASEHEITEPNTLSLNFINYVEAEVSRLEQLKSSKMKELILKKRTELEEICSRIHVVSEAYIPIEHSIEAIESGAMEPTYLLEQVELQIAKVKEEAFSRKEILDKVVKWLAACDEECWLEEYNRDGNRYNAGRGAHVHLKRAEKARALVSKIPAMTDALTLKAKAWEEERGIEFSYDGVRLLSMLDQYNFLRQEKEQERQRQREQKRLQGQLIAEQEALFGSKPSPSKSGKKLSRISTIGAANRRLSHGGMMLQAPNPEKAALHSCPTKKDGCVKQNNSLKHQQYNGSAVLSSGRTKLGIAFKPVKKHFTKDTNACEIESSVIRKPLSPISPAVVSDKISSIQEGQDRTPKRTLHRTIPPSKTPTASPSKLISIDDLENKTPKNIPIPLPTTPPTVSLPMQTASTPGTPCIPFVANQAEERVKVIEYSFEERRAAFMLPEAYYSR
ncbi:65-kDa microtubule-associated protein 3-like isoform X1 [Vitis riparia]|uniref:65-kDa microtubule-associated protein 3-like isoform X1 n=1 Tax=Vitis riparia TaxID=96939 RepID=UPI00155AEDEB|nr:65-kDa microtubule-associated protein 3-like isoform X1 [Vitis riparia]XP_034708568.1 65-kDa microtubule-associated protein 3-like isoform X1 [Vitis riparia]